MRFRHFSLRQASQQLTEPFSLRLLTEIDEYACFLFRCEGEMPLHRHLEHDELLWPLDRPILLQSDGKPTLLAAGHVACVRRGWRHGSKAHAAAHVLLISRHERALSLNGHLDRYPPHPPKVAHPVSVLAGTPPHRPHPLVRCDTLQLWAEGVAGNGPCRRAPSDLLVLPLGGTVGLRCGGIMTILQEWELARVPAGTGWHLFGKGQVVWMGVEQDRPGAEG